ncbi:general substrate transporter [Xylogone sp. PMI_703]|nr:general substrate transporter [Xylogone sp. PMI_703]
MVDDVEGQQRKIQDEQWVENTDSTNATTLATDAQIAADAERQMGLWQGIKKYRKAVAWSILISASTTMDGYDTGFLTSLFGLPAFRKDFGYPRNGGYEIPASWQSAIGNSSNIGIFIGVLINGWLTEHIGHRKILMGSYILITALIFIPFFAPSLAVLLTGEILCGLVWGQFSITGATYASEVCPLALRAYLTSYINITWIIGQLIAACVMRGVSGLSSHWAYKIPFAVQWVWPLPLLVGVYFAPESPWWLVRKGRLDEADGALKRLTKDVDTRKTLAMMVHTDRLEQTYESGTTYFDCFKGVDRRRTEIACMAWAVQVLFGLPMNAYDTYFFEQAGLSTSQAFDLNVGDRLIAVTGTALSWVMLTYFDRRHIYMIGLSINITLLICIGFSALSSTTGSSWAQSILLMFWPFLTSLTIGSTAFSIVSEVSSTRLRSKTIALARNTFNLLNVIFGAVMPYLFNPDEANLKGKAAFIFVFLGLCCFVYVFFRLPELKNRTYEELDILFMTKVKARDFKKTEVRAYQEDVEMKDVVTVRGN